MRTFARLVRRSAPASLLTAALIAAVGIGCAAPARGDAPASLPDAATPAAQQQVAAAPAAPVAMAPAPPPAVFALAPLDMSSPRATLAGFIATVDLVYAELRQHGLGSHRRPVNRHRVRQILGCLDLGSIPASLIESEGIDAVVALKEVLDRIPLPAAAEVPDAAAAAAGPIKRWRLPGTEIVLERIATGPREGDYVFSCDTVDRAGIFYERIRGLPYRPDAGSPGLHDLYVESGGWMIPEAFIAQLPAWAHARVLGETVWQWAAALLVAAAACGMLGCAWRCANDHGERPQPGSVTSLLLPAALVAVGVGVDYLLSTQIRLTGEWLRAATILLRFVTLAGVVAAVVVVMEWLAELLIRARGPRAEGIESQLVRLGGKVGTFLVVAWIVIEAADSVGIPVAPLVAGLGAGGLAVALASQYTLEHLFAGLVLFADKPVRIGDDCQFGGVRGRIEQIGLRSTRIRGADRTVISIPNADLAKQQVVNYTARDHIPLELSLEVESRLAPRLVRGLLVRLEMLLVAHPRLADKPVTARLAAQSSTGYTLRIAAVALTSDEQEFQEIREDVLLMLLEEIRAADDKVPRARAA